MKRILIFILLFNSSINFGQIAIIKSQKVFPDIKENLNYIKFEINGQPFGEKDTIIKIQINKSGFDKCTAIINKDTLNFLAKFKENEIYEITQGCCCAAFVLEAQKNPKRGTVSFKNKTNRDLSLIVAHTNADTVKIGKRQTTFASESTMCYFKPCPILITETEYLSTKYNYDDERDRDKLRREQEQLKLALIWFHFLHGEKIEVIYNPTKTKLDLNLNGYLSKKEHKKAIEKQ